MRISRMLTAIFGLLALGVLLAVGYVISRPRGPIITAASVGYDTITPNADGNADVTTITYHIRRRALVSIYFLDDQSNRYNFRTEQSRAKGDYSVDFGGVVDGFVFPGETVHGDVISRLLPNGTYTWVIEAKDVVSGAVDQKTGTLNVVDGDDALPDIWEFTISPDTFTPNQDGLDDLVYINVYIPKPATLSVYLLGADGKQYFVPEYQQDTASIDQGRHSFRWDGGVNDGRTPPPDGTYTVMVEATDAEGQYVKTQGSVSVAFSGIPFAQIMAQPVGHTVEFSSYTVALGDVLHFRLTVRNYGESPIRTTGPESGYIYNQEDLFGTSGYYEESGAWRVGIHCSTCLSDFPWRWALGTYDNLTQMVVDGHTQYYLMPGQQSVVEGGIRLTHIVEARNPQEFWAGLIHEDVGIDPLDTRVDPQWIQIVPDALNPSGAGG